MTKGSFMRVIAAVAAVAAPAAVSAQGWTPGAEITGQSVQVTTNGVANTLYFDAGGGLRIVTPGGNTVPGTWQASGGQLCLSVSGSQECVPYASPFQAGQPVALTSSCNAAETWLATATNQPASTTMPGSERGK